jgi:TolB-like protein/Flp pilus assembly protein TadD
MKRCPQCNRVENDESLLFCRIDGARLVSESASLSREDGATFADETGTARLRAPSSASDEIETSILPHATDARISRGTALTTVLPSHAAQNTTSEFSKPRSRKTVIVVGALIAVVFVAAIITGGYLYFSRKSNTAIQSIAVLPFENRSGTSDTDYLSDGLADSLIFRLSQLPDLKVSPTSSVIRYKGKDTDVAQIAKELDVDAVMSGRLVQRGDDLSISVQLIDSRTKKLVWAEQYERKMSDLLATQREIAATIADKLQLKLSGNDNKGINKRYTESNEAYQLYLKGRFYWNRRTESDVRKGIEYFRQAVEADPKFALAWAGLADSYALLPAYSQTPTGEFREKIREATTKALELDPNLAEAHNSRAGFLAYYEWNFVEAEKEFRRAIELNPNYATAHHWFSLALSSRLRHDEALKESSQALYLEPFSRSINTQHGEVLLNAGQIDKAIEQFGKTLELYPDFAYAHRSLALALAKVGKYQEAINEQSQAIAIGGRLPLYVAELGYINVVAGNRREADKLLAELMERKKKEPVENYNVAVVYAGLGEKDQAFDYLEKAYQERSFRMPYITVYPYFDSLRDDSRYKDIVRRVGLQP